MISVLDLAKATLPEVIGAMRLTNTVYGIFLIIVIVGYCMSVQAKRYDKITSNESRREVFLLAFVVIVLIVFGIGGDKYAYAIRFSDLRYEGFSGWYESKEHMWYLFNNILSALNLNAIGYFAVIAVIYVGGNACYCIRQTRYALYLFIAVISFMGFYSYGINTLRAGLALSILLFAMIRIDKSIIQFVALAVISSMVHTSVIIPALCFVLATYYRKMGVYLAIWVICLLASFITDGAIKEYVIEYFSEEDARVVRYIGENTHEYYQVGFRWDFILYSLLPIIVGYFSIKKAKVKDNSYIRIYNTYVLANAFWLIVIAVPFTDRLAYLSWFLYPYVLLLPFYGRLGLPVKIQTAALYTVAVAGFNAALIFFR